MSVKDKDMIPALHINRTRDFREIRYFIVFELQQLKETFID
ncbi:hypothetical protein [Leptolyngbya sp. Heron Island J]|nr:hypothetical protein [Leptolyngbya sp. Heron Island J]